MCTLAFSGKGYSLGFIKNYKKIVQELNNNEDTLIEVVEYMDSTQGPTADVFAQNLPATLR